MSGRPMGGAGEVHPVAPPDGRAGDMSGRQLDVADARPARPLETGAPGA